MLWLLGLGVVGLVLFESRAAKGTTSSSSSNWVRVDPRKPFGPGIYRLSTEMLPEQNYGQTIEGELATIGFGITSVWQPGGPTPPSDWPHEDGPARPWLRVEMYNARNDGALPGFDPALTTQMEQTQGLEVWKRV